MTKHILTILAAVAIACPLYTSAVPAWRGTFTATQPDGTVIELRKIGDEFGSVTLTADGLPVEQDANGTYRYITVTAQGLVASTGVAAVPAARRTPDIQRTISGIDIDAVIKARLAGADKRRAQARAEAPGSSIPQSGKGLCATSFPSKGSPKALIILVEYQDVKFTTPNAADYFNRLVHEKGFSDYGGTGSVDDYFDYVSMGQFTPKFDVLGPVTLPEIQSYYGAHTTSGSSDRAPQMMVVHAAEILDDTVDFSQYDNDGDGYVDNVFVFYAGLGEASGGGDNTVWPHSWDITSSGMQAPKHDGVRLNHYACSNEWQVNRRPDGIGTFVHEFSHVMGLPDLYTTTYNEYRTLTPGQYSVLDYGPYNNNGCTPPAYSAYERNALGWVNPTVLDSSSSITLPYIGTSNETCIVPTENVNEFFLIENRQQTGWDKFIPGHGMLIWHIDFNPYIFNYNVVNNQAHQYVDIEEACGSADNTNDKLMAAYPFPGTKGKSSFTDDTNPSMITWGGKRLDTPLTEIAESNGIITFNVKGGKVDLADVTGRKVADISGNAATLSWNEVDLATDYEIVVKAINAEAVTFHSGDAATYRLTGLNETTSYSATVTATRGTNRSKSASLSFTTTKLTFVEREPVAETPHDVSTTGFTAVWQPVVGATGYQLQVSGVFDNGTANIADGFGSGDTVTLPDGWSCQKLEDHSHTNARYCGNAAPALILSNDNKWLQSPVLPGTVTEIAFWYRATETNALTVEGIDRKGNRVGIVTGLTKANPTGKLVTFNNIPEDIIQLIFTYTTGTLTIDDISVTYGTTVTTALDAYNWLPVGNVLEYDVDNLPAPAVPQGMRAAATTSTRYIYTVRAVDDDGNISLPSNAVEVNLANPSGIADAVDSTGITLGVSAGAIAYTGPECTVTAYDIAGRAIATAFAADGECSLAVPAGLYIVRAGTHAAKILVR